ncbi:uncharacterized protein K02A2.6-like [Patiria miniata]|uniref:RNA-directed DNA polymerase n=1 Tax=Patiria miniata TaxID=46514 RepID=A0A914A9G9_PATMI|nr:uncharacterized protein K02A2.6-like [Patiria miniata]
MAASNCPNLPSFPNFQPHTEPSTVGLRWQKYVKRLENLFVAFNIVDDKQQRALLLHYAGQEVMDIFETLADTGSDYKTAKEQLDKYFSPRRNIEYERFVFREAKQSPTETVGDLNTRLQQLAQKCEFHDLDSEVKSQIIRGCSSSKLRRYALREADLTLTKLLTTARAYELSDTQAKSMEKHPSPSTETVHKVHSSKYRSSSSQQLGKSAHMAKPRHSVPCRNCGGTFPHKTQCPAKGVTCHTCGKLNHFAKHCLSRGGTRDKPRPGKAKVHAVDHDAESSSEDEYVFGVKAPHRSKQPVVTVRINKTPIKAIIDTGASVSVMSAVTYGTLQSVPKLQRHTNTKIFAYGSTTPLEIVGTFEATVAYKSSDIKSTFYVTKQQGDTLISFTTASELGIIHVAYNIQPDDSPQIHQLLEHYSDRFIGIGKLKDFQCILHEDKSVQPIALPHRRIPFQVRKKVEAELRKLLALDIIEPVRDEPTPWVSPIHVVEKPKRPGEIRMCVDMRNVNKAIKRERHVTPTIDDIIADVNGSTVFSKLDLNAGYHQVELSPESRHLTVFSTHAGLYRYKRLNFGVCSAAEVFQNIINATLQGLEGVLNISDDILVFGSTQQEHDTRLKACLNRLRERNLTLNKDKCRFSKSRVEYFGHIFSRDGVSPDPKKVQAIQDVSEPQNASEVRSFLGLVTYCSRFIPDLATISAPLRELTKDSVPWSWGPEQQQALKQAQERVSQCCTMAYYDPTKKTEIVVDASPVGLAGILAQRNANDELSVVALASRSLTPVEQRYSQTEREALAITWAVLHFHLYVYGGDFTIVTDHKPLVTLFNSPNNQAPARIERWILKLQEYNYTVEYQPGKLNPADYMSRHPQPHTRAPSREQKIAEEHLNFIAENAVPKTVTLEELQTATQQDPVLQNCINALVTGSWDRLLTQPHNQQASDTVRSLHKIRAELTTTANRDLLLRGHRIVVPRTLQQTVVNIAHEGHQGITKTKQLLREKIWFPGIDRLVDQTIRDCLPCQASTVDTTRAPLQMSPLPNGPWLEVSVDFCDLPSGEHILVVIDDYSRFPEIEIVSSTSARAVIPKLDRIFATFGVPQVVRTDNGPPFNSGEFSNFADYLGFKHRKVTPRWPRANGEVERFMQTLKKTYRTAIADHKPWKQTLFQLLRNYRATPHATTGTPPATLLFGRPMRTRLPETTRTTPNPNAKRKDKRRKAAMKAYADKREHAKHKNITVGDTVLIRRDGMVAKDQTPYHLQPYIVTDTRGSMITARRGSHRVTRNISRFKRINDQPQPSHDSDESDLDDLSDTPTQTPNQAPRRNPPRARHPPARFKDYTVK